MQQISSVYKSNFLFLGMLFLVAQSTVFSDSAETWQVGFQDPASPIMQGIVELHHDLFWASTYLFII
jgi:hypothetical protein